MGSSPEQPEDRPLRRSRTLFYPPHPNNTRRRRRIMKPKGLKILNNLNNISLAKYSLFADKSENQHSKCSICLEQFQPTILLLPCSHMCFCDDCYVSVKERKVSICPICRKHIEQIMFVFPS